MADVLKLRYSYGVNLLSRADTAITLPDADTTPIPPPVITKRRDSTDFSEPSAVDTGNQSRPPVHSRSTSDQTAIVTEPIPETLPSVIHGPAFHTFPNTPNDSSLTLARHDYGYNAESDDESDETSSLLQHDLPRPNTGGHHLRPSLFVLQRIKRVVIRTWITFRTFMTAPLWAVLFSLVVAFVDPLKHALENHMEPLNRAIKAAGKCAIPITLVVLGAYFHDPPLNEDEGKAVLHERPRNQPESTWRRTFSVLNSTSENAAQPKKQPRPGETKTVVLAILARMIITPLLLVPFLMVVSRYDWHAVFEE